MSHESWSRVVTMRDPMPRMKCHAHSLSELSSGQAETTSSSRDSKSLFIATRALSFFRPLRFFGRALSPQLLILRTKRVSSQQALGPRTSHYERATVPPRGSTQHTAHSEYQ